MIQWTEKIEYDLRLKTNVFLNLRKLSNETTKWSKNQPLWLAGCFFFY